MATTNDVPQHKLSKVPGLLPKIESKETHLTALDAYTIPELEELRDRQKHLLANKSRLKFLPDKGERIRGLYERILKELHVRDEVNQASELLSTLNIAQYGKHATTDMEWNGKLVAGINGSEAHVPDDDLDETDPIKLLAQSRHPVKIVKEEKDVSLITPDDLAEIESFKSEPTELEPHALYMCGIEGRHASEKVKSKYLPHKTTVSNVHSVAKEKERNVGGKHWEITAATPPKLRNSEVVTLTLQDSILVQQRQIEQLKKIELKNAEERLASRSKLAAKLMAETFLTADNPSSFFKTYREVETFSDNDDDAEELDSENEVHDNYDEPAGGVSIVVYDK